MKLNALPYQANLISRRHPHVVVLGALAFSAQIACSDGPTKSATPGPVQNTAGASSVSPGASGTGTAGTSSVAGSGFGTAGSAAGGTDGGGGAAAGSAGETQAGTAGTGGSTPVVVVPPYCEDKTLEPLPYTVTQGFKASGWSEGGPTGQISVPTDLAVDACTTRVPDAVGDCSTFRFTPSPELPHAAWVIWSLQWDAQYKAPPVCLAEGAKAIVFHARGVEGGEVVTFGGANSTATAITLTDEWKEYSVSLENVTYNTRESGVPDGFSWKIEPTAETPITTFFVDNIRIVEDAPAPAN